MRIDVGLFHNLLCSKELYQAVSISSQSLISAVIKCPATLRRHRLLQVYENTFYPRLIFRNIFSDITSRMSTRVPESGRRSYQMSLDAPS